jgi:hypothetical protein
MSLSAHTGIAGRVTAGHTGRVAGIAAGVATGIAGLPAGTDTGITLRHAAIIRLKHRFAAPRKGESHIQIKFVILHHRNLLKGQIHATKKMYPL